MAMKNKTTHMFSGRFGIGVNTILFVATLVILKIFIHQMGLDFFVVNTLFSSVIGGVVFITGFLLSGIIADYKEADKIPSELRSSLETIWEEAKLFHRKTEKFSLSGLKETLLHIVRNFFAGLGHDGEHYKLEPCVASVNALSKSFAEMEKLGMPPNYIVRLKGEQSAVRRSILRVYHIQRTSFLPSAHILAESLTLGAIALLLFLKTEGSPESYFLFGFISYLFLYVRMLIRTIEKPFRQGHKTMDDVSLFLLHEFEKQLVRDKKQI